MSFISFVFFVFLAVVYALWRLLPYAAAKRMLCLASFVFYSYWFPPFLAIFLTSGVVDYVVSIRMPKSQRPGQLLALSIAVNLGLLGLFKYADFFLIAWHEALAAVGIPSDLHLLHLILPIGISFYTFQSLSYTIDVYRGRLKPCDNPVDFFLFFSFFPHLVAGPILRAADFLPQVGADEDPGARRKLSEEDFRFVVYRLSRGYFLKVLVADNAAIAASAAFRHDPALLSSPVAWLGILFFAVQIFGDFAGYSDIALGTARLFGYRIRENFWNPYCSFGIEDFWHRWHISLSSWFRDYLYIPLGGNRISPLRTKINLLIVFVVSGFWHGANWTFLIWGGLHGIAVTAEKMLRSLRPAGHPALNRVILALSVPLTFALVLVLWVPFRAPDVDYMWRYWQAMIPFGGHGGPFQFHAIQYASLLLFAGYFAVQVAREHLGGRWIEQITQGEALAYFSLTLLMPGPPADFIYFQF